MFEHATVYLGIFLICLFAGIGIPFPEDVAVALAGVQVKSGSVNLWPALALAGLGTLGRDIIVWCVGRYFGDWALQRPWLSRLIGAKRIENARTLVLKRGALSVLLGRALVGMRVPVFFVTGTMRIPLVHFIKWDVLGLMVTTPILVGLGAYLGAPLVDGLRASLAQAGWIPWVLGAVIAIFFVTKFALSRRKQRLSTDPS